MTLPNKATLLTLQQSIATAQANLSVEVAHQASVRRLITEIETEVMAGNFEPTSGAYGSRVVADVIEYFKTTEYAVVLIDSNSKMRRFKVS